MAAPFESVTRGLQGGSMPVPFFLIVILSTLIDALVVALCLWFLRRRRRDDAQAATITLTGLLAAALVTTGVFGVKLLLLRPLGTNPFGVIHLVYVDLVVLVPAVGIALLLASFRSPPHRARRPVSGPARLAACASLVLIPIGLYATWIEPFRLQVEHVKLAVASARAGKDTSTGTGTLRIGVLSDLQTTCVSDYERMAVDRLLAARPDMIVLPGDVHQGSPAAFEADLPALRALLARLSAPGGVYLVLGDIDGDGAHLRQALASTSVRLLVNEIAEVSLGNRRIAIGGVELDFDSEPAARVVARLEAEEDDTIRILLAHRPDVVLGLRPHAPIDLVVAGHTHGGQVFVPGYGPPLTLSEVPRTVAAGGLHTLRGNAIYVSRGVGCEHGQAPRIRFLCPPEISLIDLQ
jgi:predicted MPP superfamily phosphohydrolase